MAVSPGARLELDLVLLWVAIDSGLNVRMLSDSQWMAYDSGAARSSFSPSQTSPNADEVVLETTLVGPGVEILTTSSLSVRASSVFESNARRCHAVMLGPSGWKDASAHALEGMMIDQNGFAQWRGPPRTTTRRLYRLRARGAARHTGIRLVIYSLDKKYR